MFWIALFVHDALGLSTMSRKLNVWRAHGIVRKPENGAFTPFFVVGPLEIRIFSEGDKLYAYTSS
jgi:hypothetical protein